jgi:hypothetical protein
VIDQAVLLLKLGSECFHVRTGSTFLSRKKMLLYHCNSCESNIFVPCCLMFGTAILRVIDNNVV